MHIVKEIGKVKNINNLPVIDEKRFEGLLQKIKEKAKGLHIEENFIEKLFKTIHDHAVEIQKKV
jgi:chorismate mutase